MATIEFEPRLLSPPEEKLLRHAASGLPDAWRVKVAPSKEPTHFFRVDVDAPTPATGHFGKGRVNEAVTFLALLLTA